MSRIAFLLFALAPLAWAAEMPPAATRPVDFQKDIAPLFEASCVKCHAKGREKGGFSIETRASFLKGGETGKAAELGHSKESLIVELVAGVDPDNVMPKKGARWTPEQVGLLRAWIDQGAAWPEKITFARPAPLNLQPRDVPLPAGAEGPPIDRLLARYFAEHQVAPGAPVDDAGFARRAYLDAIGLLPTPAEVHAFVAQPDRAALVRALLERRRDYADHWLTFWNDLLRNDYRGAGFIDGGRKQISEWLYTGLLNNKPYHRFVSELVNPDEQALGFTAGIIWRGNVAAAMTPPMQAAQSVSQVFLGINLKCASCHDSFVSDWTLADAYGMAAVFAEHPLELVRCDKPTGQKAALRFLYPEVGALDPAAPRAERLQRFASLMTEPKNGRLSRTLVNRLWARLIGRGLVEPLDDMDRAPWSTDLLDWLASDFEAHGYDIKRTIETIMTSSAYGMAAAEPPAGKQEYVFRGPLVRRLTAEQFADALSMLADEWAPLPSTLEFDLTGGGLEGSFTLPKWIWTDEPVTMGAQRTAWRYAAEKSAAAEAAANEAQRKIDRRAPDAPAAMEAAKKAAEASAEMARWAAGPQPETRHKVVFRKTFQVAEKPERAYATVLVSQAFEVALNGATLKPKMTDGFRNGRVRLYDLGAWLRAGENLLAISVDSHTDKSLTDPEKKEFPGALQHLNRTSGLACYLAWEIGGKRVELLSDETWRVRRAPEGLWSNAALSDNEWTAAQPLAAGVTPVDEGPGLAPIRREDFANIPVALGPALRPACSTAAFPGHKRASLLAADPLQVALDRPNREIVITSRANTATTLQALELTNGATLSKSIDRAAGKIAASTTSPIICVDDLYRKTLGRGPTQKERGVALELLGPKMDPAGVADLLWGLVNLPEFQFIR
ncbi:MAG TPA: DUF1549 domain-containing protein [Chthoniobacteraceae bacterium]|jgi:mono/diheme cytochrome c family protein|nr:DUF1549 domain-containing protein [Chthoniobacteraceae bacterium]